jgi:hypothetical protein
MTIEKTVIEKTARRVAARVSGMGSGECPDP